MPGLSFFQAAMIALSAAMRVDLRREVGDVRTSRLEGRGPFVPSPPKTFAFLPCSASWLRERLRVARLLRREEHDVGVARDLRHVGREVRDGVGHGLVVDGHARGLERLLDLARETLRVRLLEVEDHDVLDLEHVDHVLGVGRALVVVGRDDAEERLRRLLVVALGQRRARRRRGDLRRGRPA